MKSFLELLKEDAGFNRKKEEEPEKDDGIDKEEFVDNIGNGPKAVVSFDSFLDNPKKQMKYTYSFGAESKPFPYELTFVSRQNYPQSWDIYFSKGFDKLKSKDKSTIEKCLYGVEEAMCDFANNDEFEGIEDTEKMSASIRYENKEMKNQIEEYFKKAKLSTLKHLKYKFENSFDDGITYMFIAHQEKKKRE